MFTLLTLENFSQRYVKLTGLESGTDYEVALFGTKNGLLAQLNEESLFKTKTISEIKQHPFVRASVNRHGVLGVEVENIF